MYNVKHISKTNGDLAVITRADKFDDHTVFYVTVTKEDGSIVKAVYPEKTYYESFRFYSFLQSHELQAQEEAVKQPTTEDVNEDIIQLIDAGYKFKSFFGDTVSGRSVSFDLN